MRIYVYIFIIYTLMRIIICITKFIIYNVGFHAFVENVYVIHTVYQNIYIKYPKQSILYIIDETILSDSISFMTFIKILKCIKSASQ